MKWYEACMESVQTIEVERFTDSSVWVRGRRRPRLAEYWSYFDSFEKAKSYLVSKAELELKQYENRVVNLRAKVEALKKLSHD